MRSRMPCEIECDVRYADVRWSVSPASPACGRSTKVSKDSHEFSAKKPAAAGVRGLTESPLSPPVVQIGDVGEHVINPVICKSCVVYDEMPVADQ